MTFLTKFFLKPYTITPEIITVESLIEIIMMISNGSRTVWSPIWSVINSMSDKQNQRTVKG